MTDREKNRVVVSLTAKADEENDAGDYLAAFAHYSAAVAVLTQWPPRNDDAANVIIASNLEPLRPKLLPHKSGNGVEQEEEKCPEKVPSSDLKNDFDSLAGLVEEKDKINKAFVLPYLLPKLYVKNKAILLYGPPGTGKTQLAKASAAEIAKKENNIKVSLFLGGGAEFKSKWVGGTENKIKQFFACGEKVAKEDIQICRKEIREKLKSIELELRPTPDEIEKQAIEGCRAISILFIDEIDAIASKRENADIKDVSTTSTLITQIDGATSYENVVVMAATNRPWSLDSAIERRFATKMFVDLPTDEARKTKIIQKINDFYGSMDRIKTYGSLLCLTEVQIDELVQLTGFSTNAVAANQTSELDTFKSGRVPDQSLFYGYDQIGAGGKKERKLWPNAAYIFGYSQSDMDKMLNKAFNKAADRSLTSPFVKREIQTTTGETVERYLPSTTIFPGDAQEYYYKGSPSSQKIIPTLDYPKVSTFDLRKSDIERAISEFRSTVNPQEYVGYLYYNKTDKIPTW